MVFEASGVSGTLSKDGRTLRLICSLWVPRRMGGGFTVPEGFITDFASVPRMFWRICPPIGRYAAAAVAHDYLYRNGIGTRKEADRVFLNRMEDLGVPRWKRKTMYRAVRMFGGRAWQGE